MSAIAARLSASVTTTQRQSCALLPVGACIASLMHSSMTSRPTGRFRSRRLRTARVVLSSSSTVAMSIYALPGCARSDIDGAGLVHAEDRQRASQAEKHCHAEREVEDLLVGERPVQPRE